MPRAAEYTDDESDTAPAVTASDSEELSDVALNDDDEDEDDDDDDDSVDGEFHQSTSYDAELMEEDYEAEVEEPVRTRPSRGSRPSREVKKRQLSFYDEDDLLDSEEEPPKKQAKPKPKQKKKSVPVKLKIPKRAAARVASTNSKAKASELSEAEDEYNPNQQRLTERQRAKLEEEAMENYEDSTFARMDEQLLALNRKTAGKKKETAEEMAQRKAENARKRAHYKEKQLEEEKRETLNKLLKRRATKTRENVDEASIETKHTLKPRRPVREHEALLRWVCKPESSVLAFNL